MSYQIAIASLITVGFLVGIRLLQSPRTAVWGNRLGALSMVLAIIFALYERGLLSEQRIWLYMVAGAGVGAVLALRVRMVNMPQMVGMFNGLGGGASALVAATAAQTGELSGWFFWWTAVFALALGTVTFSGSAVAALKLQGMITGRAIVVRGHGTLVAVLMIAGAAAMAGAAVAPDQLFYPVMPATVLAFVLVGIYMTIRIGGADMPIVISFLNSLSGVAAAVCGLAVNDMLLAGVGALVGVAGLILTQLMCVGINRSLFSVLGGPDPRGKTMAATAQPQAASWIEAAADSSEVELAPEARALLESGPAAGEMVEAADVAVEEPEPKEVTDLVREASSVIIVPGYGMAVAQAQHAVRELVDLLEGKGKEVKIAVHPVAGRMPGHMNVLLAEAGLDYDKFVDMDDINPEFANTDLVIIVGACDVVNPAARTAEQTPIQGMPVLHVEEARSVIVLNLDDRPGYSGVPNPLYGYGHCTLVLGNAADTLPGLIEILKS